MHLPNLTEKTDERLDAEDYDDGAFIRYTEMREEVERRIEEAKGLISGLYQIRLLLYIQYRAQREHGFVV
jgi:hypothetical protein